MYFSTFHFYFEEENIAKEKEKEEVLCIICWDDRGITYELKNLINDHHICCYSGKFHKDCLYKWFNKNDYCPMCREKVNVLAFINKNKKNLADGLGEIVYWLFFLLRYCHIFTYIFIVYFMIFSVGGMIIKTIF